MSADSFLNTKTELKSFSKGFYVLVKCLTIFNRECAIFFNHYFFLSATMRIKYRINPYHYQDFYRNLVRKKLSDFLLEKERRSKTKAKRDQQRELRSPAVMDESIEQQEQCASY